MSRHEKHPLRSLRAAAAMILIAGFLAAPAAAEAQVDYRNAEQLLGWNLSRIVVGDDVSPQWLSDGDRFWYRATRPDGADFVLVAPDQGSATPLFDNARLAAAMSMAGDTTYDPQALPFTDLEFIEEVHVIAVRVGERRFECDLGEYDCTVGDTVPRSPVSFVMSPDSTREAFVHEHDLWLRMVDTGDSIQLTDDGEEYWAYGLTAPRPNQVINGQPRRPVLQWSPDSRRIAVQRMDEREVEHFPMYSSTSERPRGFTYPYSIASDSIIQRFDIHLVDADGRSNVRIDMPPQPYTVFTTTGMDGDDWVTVQWTDDGERFFFTHGTRGARRVQLMEADIGSGDARIIVRDTTHTHIELSASIMGPPAWKVLDGGDEVIWYSQRDGWGHLYRYDAQGNLLNRITEGPWTVGHLIHVDEDAGRIHFTAYGREDGWNPVLAALYRVGLDGSGLELLTPEEGDHDVEFSPSGRYLVNSYSFVDRLPVAVLRRPDGTVVLELEEGDASMAEELGWQPPVPFTVKDRTGVYDIHGIMYLPSHFDPSKKYPVINHIYPGPFRGSVGAWGFNVSGRGGNHALAELGFVVVQMDHSGTNFRSKAFRDRWYGDMGDHGLPDHVAALRQLGVRHDWIDLDRVGIYGGSGGGFASTAAMLRYPDVFHVAVSGAGNHDNRTYHAAYVEKYQGLFEKDEEGGGDNFESQANYLMAENLEGKLFLIHGDLDDNVHPAMTLRVAHALIEANKDFDFLILPDRAHSLNEPYVVRKRWDYFVEHLLGETPPREYEIVRPQSRP